MDFVLQYNFHSQTPAMRQHIQRHSICVQDPTGFHVQQLLCQLVGAGSMGVQAGPTASHGSRAAGGSGSVPHRRTRQSQYCIEYVKMRRLNWSRRQDLNPRPAVYKSPAGMLPGVCPSSSEVLPGPQIVADSIADSMSGQCAKADAKPADAQMGQTSQCDPRPGPSSLPFSTHVETLSSANRGRVRQRLSLSPLASRS